MDNNKLKTVLNSNLRLPKYDSGTGRYTQEVALSIQEQTIQRPHAEATVDARPGLQLENVETFWFDPQGTGVSNKRLDFDPDGPPTSSTPDTKYDRRLYWRFEASGQTYEYLEVITYLKNVYGATLERPWVPSKNTVGEIYLVRTEYTDDGVPIEFLVDHLGNVYFVEQYVIGL